MGENLSQKKNKPCHVLRNRFGIGKLMQHSESADSEHHAADERMETTGILAEVRRDRLERLRKILSDQI